MCGPPGQQGLEEQVGREDLKGTGETDHPARRAQIYSLGDLGRVMTSLYVTLGPFPFQGGSSVPKEERSVTWSLCGEFYLKNRSPEMEIRSDREAH